MVSKEACYKGPPFKTRFHELDGCQASGKAKNDARRSVAIASLSSLFWYDKEYILEFIFRWKTTQGLVKNVIKSSILFVTKEWRGAVYFLFYVEQTRQACLNPQKRFSFCQNDAGMLRYEKQVKLKKKNKIFWRGAKWHKVVGEMRKCVGEVTQVVGEVTQVVGEMKQFCWGSDTKIVGEMPQIQSAAYPIYLWDYQWHIGCMNRNKFLSSHRMIRPKMSVDRDGKKCLHQNGFLLPAVRNQMWS